MDNDGLLKRLAARIADLGTTERAVSIEATGSADTIRNWRRRHDKGERFSMRIDSLNSVAAVLGVSSAWLATGNEDGEPEQPEGLAEETVPFQPRMSQSEAVRLLYADTARRAEIVRRMAQALPALGLEIGDLLVCDLGRESVQGDTVLVHVQDSRPHGSTLIRRWFSPWLLSGHPETDAKPLRDDQIGVTVRYPVIGSIRGA